MLKLLEIGLNSPECVKIVCKVCESVWKSVWECMKLRILNVLTKTAPTIPQTPHTDLKYPYVPKMAIRTHCDQDTKTATVNAPTANNETPGYKNRN